ncbi:MAG: methyltransferase domain-containing protein, partial [Candidatus Coatesbacteria bacterium]
MSYLYMKILELIPEEYDRGIQKFAATDFEALREEIASGLAVGQRLLDVGCGPGTLALLAASRGVRAVGWDRNPDMITFARGKAVELDLSDNVTFEVQDAPVAAVDAESFDVVVMSLALSEMRGAEQLAALETARRALKPGGRLVIVDEVPPSRFVPRAWYYFKRFWLKLVVYVVARAVTRPLKDLPATVAARGFVVTEEKYFEGGALLQLAATKAGSRPAPEVAAVAARWTLGDVLANVASSLTLYSTFFRVAPGLYRLGEPGPEAPLLVTANFTLTFNLVRRALRGRDAYVLVIDSRGINVWCAAGGHKFTTREVALSHRAFRLAEVAHREPMVLPQFAATGVARHKLRADYGVEAAFGPVYVRDFPAYADAGYRKTAAMRLVDWGLAMRMEVTWYFALMNAAVVALPLALFPRLYSPLVVAAVAAISLLLGALFPWLPTRLYSLKGLGAAVLTGVPLLLYKWSTGAGASGLARWGIFLAFAGILLGLEFSGNTSISSPSQVRQEFKPG